MHTIRNEEQEMELNCTFKTESWNARKRNPERTTQRIYNNEKNYKENNFFQWLSKYCDSQNRLQCYGDGRVHKMGVPPVNHTKQMVDSESEIKQNKTLSCNCYRKHKEIKWK